MADDFKMTPEMLEAMRKSDADKSVKVTKYEPCLCGKLLDVLQWERLWYSGRLHNRIVIEHGINYTELLCDDCRKEFHEWPRIVCLGCRSLMGFYKPGKQQTGFEFEKRRHYHIASCPKCKPESRSTPVIEHERFCRVNAIPTTTNYDLLQEIEQKVLQGDQETARMRAEYEASKLSK